MHFVNSVLLIVLLVAGLLLVFLPASAVSSERSYSQFQMWFPQYRMLFQTLLERNCTEEYEIYLYGTADNTTVRWEEGGEENAKYVQPVVQCLLGNANDYTKTSMSMSQLILGLAPTILAFMGASSAELALLAVVGRRPIFSTILALASPSIFVGRAFEYDRPREILQQPDGRYYHAWDGTSTPGRRMKARVVVFLQYIVALACLANIALANWQLGTQAVCFLSPAYMLYPMNWTLFGGIVVHGFGCLVLRLRARRSDPGFDPLIITSQPTFIGKALRFFKLEFTLLGKQEDCKVFAEWFGESAAFIFAAWASSLLSVVHIVFGTLIFSGTLFVGPIDALGLFFRYVASSLGSQILLRYELSGLREAYNAGLREEGTTPGHEECGQKVKCESCGSHRDLLRGPVVFGGS
ncbi:hypothetical protein GQ53DRAFT_875801 [Thozetella sp. PMI_491]|nr:hypothetical protein GQ53DRAFT_875801 [Thozetella sp. PMI_491]